MTADFIVVIPARYASTRLPGKPLADIGGRPMIEWAYRQAKRSGAREVIVATDDERIAAACRSFGAPVELTSVDHPNGTDRVAELAHRFAWDEQQIVVNVQGDEPLIPPLCIAQTAQLLASHPRAAIATLMAPIQDAAELADVNVAKVVTDRNGWALYFSRAPIPWARADGWRGAKKHIGLYAYRAGGLKAISAAPACALEETERLEQLRALWLGLRIIVGESAEPASPHVETNEDLTKVRRYIRDHAIRLDQA
jgi:3-deoxy-manno-octulosonate cytidylyltransferase (CMP-KDO synthetase)